MKLNDIDWCDDKTFGEYLDFNMPFECDMVVICINKKYGHEPKYICLPHQIYKVKLKDLIIEHNAESITIIPYKNYDKFTIAIGDIFGGMNAENI